MNVIMPTAMMTMHQDPDLQAQSALTGSRGARLLEFLGQLSPEVDTNCKAIFVVASDTDSSGVDTKLLKVCTVRRLIHSVLFGRNLLLLFVKGRVSLLTLFLNPTLIQFWTEFFDNWGYKEAQKADIASIMQVMLGGSRDE